MHKECSALVKADHENRSRGLTDAFLQITVEAVTLAPTTASIRRSLHVDVDRPEGFAYSLKTLLALEMKISQPKLANARDKGDKRDLAASSSVATATARAIAPRLEVVKSSSSERCEERCIRGVVGGSLHSSTAAPGGRPTAAEVAFARFLASLAVQRSSATSHALLKDVEARYLNILYNRRKNRPGGSKVECDHLCSAQVH